MTDREDRFAESLDALTRGDPLLDADDLAWFASAAQEVWGEPVNSPPGAPPRLSGADRDRLWRDIRHEAAMSRMNHEGSPVMSGTTLAAPVTTSRPTGWAATVARWQPVLSIAVMFALLIGLVGVAYTGLNRRDNGPSPTAAGLIAQGTPVADVECVVYGSPPLTTAELSEMSISDWPARHYTPFVLAEPEVGQMAVTLYENWYDCARIVSMQYDSLAGPPEELQRYLSDRAQYISFLGSNPERAPDELDVAFAFAQDEILKKGALPLNRPLVAVWDTSTGGGHPSFAPSDVYQLTDGRYGVIIGTITTEQLQALAPGAEVEATPQWLTWVAFVSIDGQLFIDEYVPFCLAPPGDDALTEQSIGTNAANCQPMGVG